MVVVRALLVAGAAVALSTPSAHGATEESQHPRVVRLAPHVRWHAELLRPSGPCIVPLSTGTTLQGCDPGEPRAGLPVTPCIRPVTRQPLVDPCGPLRPQGVPAPEVVPVR